MKIRDITLGAMLLAIALTVFVIESRIPVPVPIPGFKLGLSNILTLVTIYLWDKKYSFAVLMLRIIIGAIVCGSGITVLYSFAGGIACFGIMCILSTSPFRSLIPAVSMAGATAHNLAQLGVAAFVLESGMVFVYLPALCAVGLVSGLFTGLAGSAC
ncbi:MAG: Gx transporter family protein, partial [Clostridia bacterium]|nr:Gx transporter family protein [Clostridia bacterium]